MNSKARALRSCFITVLSALLLSCSGGVSEEQDSGLPGPDGGTGAMDADASAMDADASAMDADGGTKDADASTGDADASTMDADAGFDNDNDFATATSVMVNAPGDIVGAIDVPNDVDFYRIEIEAGQYLRIVTDSHFQRGETDTVLELYDEAKVLLATADTAYPSVFTDSELVHRIAVSGTYFVKVQDWSSWSPDATEALGGPAFPYSMRIRTLNDDDYGTAIDDETGDDLASAKPTGSGTIVGTFEDEGDVDVYWISGNPTWGRIRVEAHLSGPAGSGSTTTGGIVRITTVDGSTVTAQSDLSAGYQSAYPRYQEPGVLVWISHPGGPIGTNDFYVLKAFGFDGFEEVALETNDDASGAGVLALQPLGTIRYARIQGELPRADVDYFTFEAFANETLDVECGGRAFGSGLDGFKIEFLDSNEVVIASDVESSPSGVQLFEVEVPSPGAYFLRLSKIGQAADNPSSFYVCFVNTRTTP